MQDQFLSNPVIPVRVGIHLGDIVLDKEDIIGDSVNVASRVESLGVPGSIMVSQKVYEEIQNKQEFTFKNLGKFHFKNDRKPRNIYALTGGKLIVPKKKEIRGKLERSWWAKHQTKIYQLVAGIAALVLILRLAGFELQLFKGPVRNLAVLPLNDRIGLNPDEQYILEGLHEELIAKLSKVGVKVKPYSIMQPYRNNPKNPDELGNELNVDGLIEGSVFRSGDIYRIRVQVIDMFDQQYIAEPHEAQAKFSNISSLYADLVKNIASQIDYTLSNQALEILDFNQAVNPEAYDLYLQGRFYVNKGTNQDLAVAIDLYNDALKLDSSLGQAHVALVESYLLLGFSSNNPVDELDKFRYHLAEAKVRDPFFAKDHHLVAMVKIFDNWDWKGAIEEIEMAIKAAPDSWEPYDTYCQFLWAIGDLEGSIKAGEKAVQAEPKEHYAHCDLGWAYFLDKQYEKAEKQLAKASEIQPNCPHHNGLSILLEINAKQAIGQSLVTTIDRIEREMERSGNPVLNLSMLGYAHALEGNREEALDILKQIETENISGPDKIYIALGDYDRAFEILNNSISDRTFFQMYTIKVAPWFDPIRDDPRFEKILTRMGLADQQLN